VRDANVLGRENSVFVRFDDALAESNVQGRACWVNTVGQTDCAAPARQPIQPHVFVIASRNPAQETGNGPIAQSQLRSLSHRHHLTILLGADLIQFVYSSHSKLGHRAHPLQNSVFAIFPRDFLYCVAY